MGSNSTYIDGVHNYCDRWCERCPLTARCRVYAMEQMMNEAYEEGRDVTAESFWEAMNDLFDDTDEDLEWDDDREWMDSDEWEDIDLEAIDPNDKEEAVRQIRARHEEAWSHELAQLARNYTERVGAWLKAHEAEVKSSTNDPESDREDGPEDSESKKTRRAVVVSIEDAIAVIRWYRFQIAVKLVRALNHDDQFDDLLGDPVQNDANGSAKVSLLGLQRSLAAWHFIRQRLPGHEDAILNVMFQLDRIRRRTIATFPDATNFLRPGFDKPGE